MHQQKYTCACVTGATSGIGLAYCHHLANHGIDLILVARDEETLRELSKKLSDQYGVNAWYYPIDLSKRDSAKALVSAMKLDQLNIDLLINNAGHGDVGEFHEEPWQHHEALIQLMLTSLTELCYLLLPQLLSRQRAGIINVSSIVSLMSMPLKGNKLRVLYEPIKSYVTELSRGLSRQYADQGIKVQALCPGLTLSNFHHRIGESELYSIIPKTFWMQPEAVVKSSWRAFKRSRRSCVVSGWKNKILVIIFKCIHLFRF
ncbi:MAG: short-chain dehydrogenase [Coxiellaceae bacterium]|nr:short-chain dehydrogenase [Coxiellaceae bacterium]